MGTDTLLGSVTAKITSADCIRFLNALTEAGIQINRIDHIDELTLLITIPARYMKTIYAIAEKQSVNVKIQRSVGLKFVLFSFLKRPVLVMFFALLFLLSFYLPSRVFFIAVKGNEIIPTNLILEAAAECGIRFGASRVNVRSEAIKNALLEKIPQLQWAGINTNGCTATISVRERNANEENKEIVGGISSIVAARDGIIQSCTVYSGRPLCVVGQAVKEGQTLVSGYVDLGIVTKGTRADAEISALTFRNLDMISLNASSQRGDISHDNTRISLRIGKNVIKFYKDSGNLDTTCAKIYSERYISLPGGFQLPIAIITEQTYYYENSETDTVSADPGDWLNIYAKSYLESTMIAGQILSADTEISDLDGTYRFSGNYVCIEQIAKTQLEQMQPKD